MIDQDEPTDAETERRRDEVIKRMLATPPRPHKPPKARDPKPHPR